MLPALVLSVIALGVLAYVAAPLLRADAAEREQFATAQSEAVDLHSRHSMLLASLVDMEEDRATGKLDDADYTKMHEEVSAAAIDLMKQMDALEARPVPQPGPRAVAGRPGESGNRTK